MPSRTPISDVGSEAGAGVRLMISRSVSQARCLLKGASGQAPRWVFVVALVGGEDRVSFWDGSWMSEEGARGMERARDVAIKAKKGRVWEIIVDGG